MDIHILAIQFRFCMGIVLVVISNDFFLQQEGISRKISNIVLVTFCLFPNMLICPPDTFSSTLFIRHNSMLNLMKSGAAFFRIDIMYMIYLDVKYFSVVCLSIYYEKLAVKTTLTTMGHFFVKKLNYCLSDIICN